MPSKEDPYKTLLSEEDIPTSWYNIQADLPVPLPPPLHPGTKEPLGPEDLAPLFPMELIKQEMSAERYIEIPDEVREVYKVYRPTPLHRAYRLEKALDTPAKIFYKNESVSPAGSHKPNTAIAQAYYNKAEGVRRLTTETGAGQWGSALALACRFFGLDLKVFMVRVSYNQKPYRRSMMRVWGADVTASPSNLTSSGRDVLASDPDCSGSLGIAISEAVEVAATDPDARYSLGSVLNHVCMHQTVIGVEARAQMEKLGECPDVVIGCVGGGSNFSGIAFPFMKDKFDGKDITVLAVEPSSCSSLIKGKYEYDFGDEAELTPLVKMYTLGYKFMPSPIHAGGLRYHGMSPIVSMLVNQGYIDPVAYLQTDIFEAAMLFARTEGMIIAPETAHAVKCAIDQAVKCRESGEARSILFNLSGHGLLDLAGYDEYISGNLAD
ncbi:MAG: TrpB-like pyridoxal phosphate-dependent enzyme [Candidatus Anoxymicrobium japonicum]|uniref:Tryptophan synthase beta chain n=1 Tax=Candidatus Anoxymicrobium japonicum TaxID=2013648 RepID=A0A2N3G5M0_9ACTN|nr:MAG: TrpB-like pyridoxal phosphate-dependent enzyme [Candidatus Anoxymicrobium japonicum]